MMSVEYLEVAAWLKLANFEHRNDQILLFRGARPLPSGPLGGQQAYLQIRLPVDLTDKRKSAKKSKSVIFGQFGPIWPGNVFCPEDYPIGRSNTQNQPKLLNDFALVRNQNKGFFCTFFDPSDQIMPQDPKLKRTARN